MKEMNLEPVLSCSMESFIKFIFVFSGIWQYNVEIRKQKFL